MLSLSLSPAGLQNRRQNVAWCQSLESVTLEGAVLWRTARSGWLFGFKNMPHDLPPHGRSLQLLQSLGTVHFPLAERIGTRAFERCDALKSMPSHALSPCPITALRTVDIWRESCGEPGQNMDFPAPYMHFPVHTAMRRVFWREHSVSPYGYETLFDRKLPEAVRRIYGSAVSCFAIDEVCK